jgi:hypothetical protein
MADPQLPQPAAADGGVKARGPIPGEASVRTLAKAAEATRRLAVATRERAEATRQRAEAAVTRADAQGRRAQAAVRRREPPNAAAAAWEADADERDRVADERERIADVREAEADAREAEANERDRIAGSREARARLLYQGLARSRDDAAQAAERMALQAEAFAAYLEQRAMTGGDAARRNALAEAERDVAEVLRRNAARLHGARGPVRLERLPRGALPGG